MTNSLQDEVLSAYEQAKNYQLSPEEINSRIDTWVAKAGFETAHAIMRAVEPRRVFFPYQISHPDPLKDKLTRLFEEGKAQGMSQDDVTIRVYDMIADSYDVDAIIGMMAIVDPGRELFERPVSLWEKGVLELDMFQHRFQALSDVYGHSIHGSEHLSESFVTVCEEHWEEGILYDHGFLCVDLRTRQAGYAVATALYPGQKPKQQDLDGLKARHGITFTCVANELKHDPATVGGSAIMLGLVTDVEQLKSVPAIASDMQEVAEQWNKSWQPTKGRFEGPSCG